MRRAVWGAAQWLQRSARGQRCWFVTLTYRPECAWQPEHVKSYINRLRKWSRARGVSLPLYLWVAELQQRGALHYHLVVWLPRALSLPLPDKSGMWRHGMSQRALAIAPIGYLMKYVSKGDTPFHDYPKGAHLYGMGGLCADGRAVRGWLNLPSWARALYGVGDLARRTFGLVLRATGEVLAPVFEVRKHADFLEVRQVREVDRRFDLADVPLGELPGAFSSYPRAT